MGDVVTARDWADLRQQYVTKASELATIVERGVVEARSWAQPAQVVAYRAALAAYRADDAATRPALLGAAQALVRWAEGVLAR